MCDVVHVLFPGPVRDVLDYLCTHGRCIPDNERTAVALALLEFSGLVVRFDESPPAYLATLAGVSAVANRIRPVKKSA